MLYSFFQSSFYRKIHVIISNVLKKIFGKTIHSNLSFLYRYFNAKYFKFLEFFNLHFFTNPYHLSFGNDDNYKDIFSILKKRNGIYLEVGAVDGYFESPTYQLNILYGWKGILVDANKQLLKYAKFFRPNDEVIFSACSNFDNAKKNKTIKFLCLHHSGEIYYSEESIAPSAKTMKDKLKLEPETVPLSTLSEIISKSKILKNDFLDLIVIDVEGHELDVLKGIDFENLMINFLLIESRTCNEFLAVKEFLKNKNFRFLTQTSDIDYLYQNNDSTNVK
jgi:FkbM family methyltransferase